MNIVGHEVTINGTLPDEDIVLIEDTVLYLNDKIEKAHLTEIHCTNEGYDLILSYDNKPYKAHLRKDAVGEWQIVLPTPMQTNVSKMTV